LKTSIRSATVPQTDRETERERDKSTVKTQKLDAQYIDDIHIPRTRTLTALL